MLCDYGISWVFSLIFFPYFFYFTSSRYIACHLLWCFLIDICLSNEMYGTSVVEFSAAIGEGS